MSITPRKAPRRFSEIPLSPQRRQFQSDLQNIAAGRAFCASVSCDAELLYQFTQRCRAARCRPPGNLAYVARCLGKTLASRTELLASQYRNVLYVPSRVDALIAVEVETEAGEPHLSGLRFEDLANRTLEDIASEMKTRFRQAKRTPVPGRRVYSRFAPEGAPQWWHRFVQSLRERRPCAQKQRAQQLACVQLSSTAHWMDGRIAWGMRTYRPSAPGVMLTGQSRRPVAIGEEIAIHFCLDLTFVFDHDLVDGAPVARFVSALCEEIESGRSLEEFPIRERPRRIISSDAQKG